MSRGASNKALLDRIASVCLIIEYESRWISAVIIDKRYATTSLHCIPEHFKKIGQTVIVETANGKRHNVVIHGINEISDFVVFRAMDEFDVVPDITIPCYLDDYVAVGFPFGEKLPAYRVGHVSSMSLKGDGFFYGDSGGLPGFSGGGIFNAQNGHLMGISRSNLWHSLATSDYGDVLQMVSIQTIISVIRISREQPFDVRLSTSTQLQHS